MDTDDLFSIFDLDPNSSPATVRTTPTSSRQESSLHDKRKREENKEEKEEKLSNAAKKRKLMKEASEKAEAALKEINKQSGLDKEEEERKEKEREQEKQKGLKGGIDPKKAADSPFVEKKVEAKGGFLLSFLLSFLSFLSFFSSFFFYFSLSHLPSLILHFSRRRRRG